MISVREKLNQSYQLEIESKKKHFLTDNQLYEFNQVENKLKETIIKQQEFIVQQQSQLTKLQEENENLKNNYNHLKNNNGSNLNFYELQKHVSKLEIEKECLYEIIKNIQQNQIQPQQNQIQPIVVSLSGDISSNNSISVPSTQKKILSDNVNNSSNINPKKIHSDNVNNSSNINPEKILSDNVTDSSNINPSIIKSKVIKDDSNDNPLLNNFEKKESMKNVINELNKHFKNSSLESE